MEKFWNNYKIIGVSLVIISLFSIPFAPAHISISIHVIVAICVLYLAIKDLEN